MLIVIMTRLWAKDAADVASSVSCFMSQFLFEHSVLFMCVSGHLIKF